MSIFVIEEERWVWEDNSGRDHEEFFVEPVHGYFTDKAAAEGYIDNLSVDEVRNFIAAVDEAARKQAEHDEQREREIADLRARADAAGIGQQHVQFPQKQFFGKPRRDSYVTERRVMEIGPAE